MEYTLEDAYETLKDVQRERQSQIESLMSIIANNDVNSLNQSSTLEEIKEKQHKLHYGLLTHVLQEEPKDYPIPRTKDLHVEVVTELEENVQSTEKIFRATEDRLSETEEDITYLENKKAGLEKMRNAYLGAAKIVANRTYERECAITKKLFLEVKNDLKAVVDILFPGNNGFQDFLSILTSAYGHGGDSVYVDVTPDTISYVHFLIEADIVTYHPNDKTKVRIIDLL